MLTLLHHCGRNLLTFSTIQTVNKAYYSSQMAKRVAVVLAGCGVYDGSEIHEASAVLVHLSRGGANVSLAVTQLWSDAFKCSQWSRRTTEEKVRKKRRLQNQ